MIMVITGGFAPIAALIFPTISLLCKLTVIISEFAAGLGFAAIPTGYDFEKPLILLFIAAAFTVGLFGKKGKKIKTATTVLFASFALFIFAVSLYKILPDDRLYAAVLGDENGSAVVIHDKQTAVIVDLNGSGDAAPAVYKYLSSIGISDIAAVAANSGPLHAIPAYMEHLPKQYYTVRLFAAKSSISLPESVVFPNDDGVFYEDDGGFIEYENMRIVFYKESVIITLSNKISDKTSDKISDKTTLVFTAAENPEIPPEIADQPDTYIYIKGELFTKQNSEKIIAALDSSAAVSADTATAVYIGRSIRIDDDKNVKIIY
jgi:hypothetical protein